VDRFVAFLEKFGQLGAVPELSMLVRTLSIERSGGRCQNSSLKPSMHDERSFQHDDPACAERTGVVEGVLAEPPEQERAQ
jgi:hypothetical protein